MDAVVMAAGEGRRLRPLTERWPKPVLPIDGRPVLATLLRQLAAAGVARAAVVAGHLGEQVERLVGDGSAFGLEVVLARQPRADGSADAVRRGLAAGVAPPVVVTAADTVYRPGDLALFGAALEGADGAIAYRFDPPPGPGRAPLRVVDGLVERVIDDDPANPRASAPLWGLGPSVAARLEGLPGPPFELAQAFQRAVEAGSRIVGVEIGPTRDLTSPLDLVVHNFPYLIGEGSPVE
jgi:molybdopterin-guanine dinucleotide biosynthesis protein A